MKKITAILLMALIVSSTFSQFIELNDIESSKFTGVEPILSGEDGDIEGYCAYYVLDKGEKGVRTFEFAVIDEDLKTITKTQLSIHKKAEINSTVFNGQFFLISYDDAKNKEIKLNIIDKKGKIVTTKTISTEKRDLSNSKIYADISGEGFYVIMPIDEKKKNGYSIAKLDNKLERIWKIESTQEKGEKVVDDLISATNRIVAWESNTIGSKIKPAIVCYDAQTGEKVFHKDGYDGNNTLLYNQLRIDKNNNIYAGGSYVKGEKIKGANNTGIYILKLSPEGKELLYNKVNNKEKIQAVLKETNNSFSLGSKDKVLVEDLIINGDEIVVVSEMFRKNTNMTPAAIQQTRDLITGKYVGSPGGSSNNNSKVVMDIRDFIFFKFNQEGELTEIKPGFKEDNTKITCWYPYYTYPGMTLAKQLKEVGWFDYAFETRDNNNNSIIICKDNVTGSKPTLYTYNLDDNYVQNTIDLKQQSKMDLEKGKVGYFNALKNKTGKMVLVYYQRKLKKITLALEEL